MVAKQQSSGKWLFLSAVLALAGIVTSIYSIMHHLAVHAAGHTEAACNINATINCDAVAMSRYSEVAGVPLGVFGLGYFVAALVLLGVKLVGHKSADEHLHGYALMVGIGGVVTVVLGVLSLGVLGTVCLTCTAIYTLVFLQLLVLIIGRRELVPSGFSLKGALNGGMSAAIAVVVVIAGFNFLKPARSPSAAAPVGDQGADQRQMQVLPSALDIPLTKSPYQGLGEDYREGSDSASVVLQEFADFECPACSQMATRLEQLHKEYGDKILIVFRNYPLDSACNPAVEQDARAGPATPR